MNYLLLLLLVVIFISFFFAYFNNSHAFGQSEFTVDTLIPNDVTSITYNSDNGNIYAALTNNRIAVINSTTNNVTDIIENLQGYPSGIAYNPENNNTYLL